MLVKQLVMLSTKRILLLLLPTISLVIWIHYKNDDRNTNVEELRGSAGTSRVKKIQWFDSYHNNSGLRRKASNVDFSLCKHKNCKLVEYFRVDDREKQYGPLDADAVVFQGAHLGEFTPPVRRGFDQVFVFAEREPWLHLGLFHYMLSPQKPPKTTKESDLSWTYKILPNIFMNTKYIQNILRFRSLFNWTMTFRHDSDIPMLYGDIRPFPRTARSEESSEEDNKELETLYEKKTADAVWLVSHCLTDSRREKYVDKLQQYIKVDIFGACGENSCPKKASRCCTETIIEKYKFVLSFENTFHKDYVTEKLFEWFPRDIVPVVYGLADYQKIAPEGTYIDAANFSTPQELAEYLQYVGSNVEVYTNFLRKKRRYVTSGHPEMQQRAYCQLCDWLNNVDSHRQSYPNIDKWWQLNETSAYQGLYSQTVGSSTGQLNVTVVFGAVIIFVCVSVLAIFSWKFLQKKCLISRHKTNLPTK